MHRTHSHGFTLIELSIVLATIGLLAGGVLVGRTLIEEAKLRKVLSDVERYKTAMLTFRLKYNGLPGDLSNATDFFGVYDANATNCAATQVQATTSATCNGNGDGTIAFTFAGIGNETFRAWQHLSHAGLVAGQYGGANSSRCAGSNAYCSEPGVNVPMGDFGSYSGWTLASSYANGSCVNFSCPDDAHAWWFKGSYRNVLFLGDAQQYWTGNPIMSANAAKRLDDKSDDGKPGTGHLRAIKRLACADSGIAATANYVNSASGKHCALIFNTVTNN